MTIAMPRGINNIKIQNASNYEYPSSASKYKNFTKIELVDQLRVGHISIFPLEKIRNLKSL